MMEYLTIESVVFSIIKEIPCEVSSLRDESIIYKNTVMLQIYMR